MSLNNDFNLSLIDTTKYDKYKFTVKTYDLSINLSDNGNYDENFNKLISIFDRVVDLVCVFFLFIFFTHNI